MNTEIKVIPVGKGTAWMEVTAYNNKHIEWTELPTRIQDDIVQAIQQYDEMVTVLVGEMVVSTTEKMHNRVLIFNADFDKDGEVRMVTRNRGKGALTDYWVDERITYRKSHFTLYRPSEYRNTNEVEVSV